jgi:mannose-6-phosphate isomerase
MSSIKDKLLELNLKGTIEKLRLVDAIEQIANEDGYVTVDRNDSKPWGAYLRFDSKDAARFIRVFFPGLSLEEAQLGIKDAELSPKLLLVSPDQRLSWQYHDRRAERWAYLTDGAYHKSHNDEEGKVRVAVAGEVVQFAKGERHRLVGVSGAYTLVAEIWQHSDSHNLSDEEDIVRISDDYNR